MASKKKPNRAKALKARTPQRKSSVPPLRAMQAFAPIKMESFMKENNGQFEKMAAEAANTGKEQMDALMKSGSIWAKGMEDMMKAMTALTQNSAEKNGEAVQAILRCKTFNEFVETQNKLGQQSFDDFMSGFTKLSEISAKLATDAFEPLNSQLQQMTCKMGVKIAA